MRKFTIIASIVYLLIVLNGTVLHAASNQNIDDHSPFDFRKTRWGMSRQDVIDVEGAPAQQDETAIVYSDTLLGHKVIVGYIFGNDKLVKAGYTLEEKQYSNENSYVDAYNSIVEALKEKYGKPILEDTYWSRELYKNDYSYRGAAYSRGDVQTVTRWEHGETEIAAKIHGNKNKIFVVIAYLSKNLAKDLDKQNSEREKSKL